MKKQVFTWLTIVLVALVAAGCNPDLNETEKQIVGKWHFTNSMEAGPEDGFSEIPFITEVVFSGEFENEYFSNRTWEQEGQIIVSFHVVDEENDYDELIDLVYNNSSEGTWRVEGEELIEKGTESEMKFSQFNTLQEYDPDLDDFYINTLKAIVQKGLPEMKHEVLRENVSTIIELSENEMILENGDKETSFVRIE